MNGGVPRDPDTAPTLGPGDADDSKGGEGPDRARATLFRHAGSDAPAGVPDTLKPPAPEESVVHALRSHLGVRAEADLPGGPEPEKEISGPASERRYNEGREIARGGMGAILELFDRDIRRPVAMKVMLHERNADRVGRFIEEAQVTGQLEHPNIVPVHEIGIGPRGRIYFTMKLVQGESLQARIDRNAGLDPEEGEPTPLPEMLRIFVKVCDAVAFAHSRGVVHRDLKPDNVMVGKFGEVLVMDWGLAKVRGRPDAPAGGGVSSVRSGETGSRTLDGSVVGTPAYMPPEQADGKTEEIDERSDLWALGGILYSVLCHEAPHSGDMMANVLSKAVEGSVVPPRLRSPHLRVPPELEAVCLKAMAPAKADRYASAEALAADVLAFLDRRLVSAYRYGPLERVARWVQRHPTASTAGGVAAILVILGTFLTVSTVQEKRIADLKAAEAERGKQEAVQAKDAAEDKARTATDLLEKGRRVSAVLRSAWLDLSEAAGEIEASYFSADGTA
ncbi:MAG: serine/threonine protein kinase, partial [Planctomycetes bacterium]|nr:serine/threonine protein kinase [Planctomycetota bacterium]